jgi:multiple sugar transport system permease protein
LDALPIGGGSSPDSVQLTEVGYQTIRYALLFSLLALVIVPFLFVISVSFRAPPEFYSDPHLIPYDPVLTAWVEGWEELLPYLKNSALVATGTAIVSLLITIPGAYAFGRRDFPGKRIGFYAIVLALLFPYILLVIPISTLWNRLGIYNTIPGLWLAYQTFVAPFAIWILRDFFEKLPYSLEEAAQVYGCTQWTAFTRVILPLSMPAITSVVFLAFLVGWNDLLFSNMLTTGAGPRPAVTFLFVTLLGSERHYWAAIMAQTLIVGLPPTVLYMYARRSLTNAFAVST